MKKVFLLCFALLFLGFAAVPTSAAPEWLSASRCCQSQCSSDSGCDRICGAGLGQCRMVNSCCRACICSAS
ncbi:MAG TPA: hypothetical protein VKK31_00795 [Thermoanaerobaculia bacterium]|nr:hypothetical protein [Thermoanaerobaculia bacterium]